MPRKPKKPPTQVAKDCLKAKDDQMQFLRERVFHLDDEAAHDDDLHEQLCDEYSAEVDTIREELSKLYGKPAKTGSGNSKLIPLNGVFRFAAWQVGKKRLWIAAAREDRECPMWIVMGTVGGK